MPNSAPVYLVDASIYIFRAWFSIPDDITDVNGQPVNAVYGFSRFVMQLLKEKGVDRVVFLFDESLSESFRNEIYPPYKSNREPAPPELKAQFQQCRNLVSSLGFLQLSSNYYEADDLIGSLSLRERQQGNQIVIVSGDKDLAQLIKDNDYWWDYAKGVKLDRQGIYEKFGVYPEQIADMLAIVGDRVDNIPGVQGIGPVAARHLLNHFGSLDNILDNLSEIRKLKIRGAQRIELTLREYCETARLCHRLTEIYCYAPLPDCIESKSADLESLKDLLTHMGLNEFRINRWIEFVERR